ncbi:MAG: KilA-N domain-containing protein [Symploca sp. SIO2G7]|nr:KilA-N domain-containing protein [Symploca sp. SIO2G7]
MGKKVEKASREVNGVIVEQRMPDGFINGTAMCTAYGKKINSWFRTRDTLELFEVLAIDLSTPINYSDLSNLDVSRLSGTKYSKIFPDLVFSRGGSPENGGGTWLHPDLAIQLAQWCNKLFAIQVSRWVREWMTSAYNPVSFEADMERVAIRDELKENRRLALTDQVKFFLEAVGKYDSSSKETRMFFSRVHDELNLVLTTERASEMRIRLSSQLGKEISDSELIRDYFPIIDLTNYAALCQAAANNMENNGVHPINAIRLAVRQVLPSNYIAKPIDFTERIALVRSRIEQAKSRGILPDS